MHLINIVDIKNRIQSIVDEDDTLDGFDVLKKLTSTIDLKNLNNSEQKAYSQLLARLYCYLIPWISSSLFESKMQNNLLDLLKIENLDLKERILTRIAPFPEDSQDFVKIDYLKIFLKNTEFIGGKTISRWLKEYEEFLDYRQGNNMDKKGFLEKNTDAKKLSNKEKDLLLKTLDVFDYLKPPFDYKEDLVNEKIYDSPVKEKTANAKTPINYEGVQPQSEIEKLPLSSALEKYPKLGEQAITSARIKLNKYPEPARPSIKNWLSDYTYTMGFDPHDSATRGIYLFQNQNTRSLNQSDRQKLNYVLKVYDTNEEISIDPDSQKVIFPKMEDPRPKSNPTSQPGQLSRSATSALEKKPTTVFSFKQKNAQPELKTNDFQKNFAPTGKPFVKEKELFQKAHQMKHLSIPYKKTTSGQTMSGTFTIRNGQTQTPAPKLEKRLPSARKLYLSSAQKNTVPNNHPPKPVVEFSSPQKLPFERQSLESSARKMPENPSPALNNSSPLSEPVYDPSPLEITPRSFRNKDAASKPKNVVDLKEK